MADKAAQPSLLRRGMVVYLDPENIEGSTFMLTQAEVTDNVGELSLDGSATQVVTITVTLERDITKQGDKT